MSNQQPLNPWCKVSSRGSQWCPQKQELTINLSHINGQTACFVLTSWQGGISWRKVCEEESERNTNTNTNQDSFTESLFAIELVDHDAFAPWRKQIPLPLIEKLRIYTGNTVGMLMLLSRYQCIEELFTNNSILFWLAYTHAQRNHWTENQFVSTCQQKQIEILKACFFPATKSALKLLTKLNMTRFSEKEYQLIIELFNLDYEKLSHHTQIDRQLIKFLNGYPELVDTRLIRLWDKDNFQLLTELVYDCERMSCRLNHTEEHFSQQIRQCHTLQAVRQLHTDLLLELNNKFKTTRNQSLNKQRLANKVFPKPPLTGNKHIVPIKTVHQLRKEGRDQQHCVLSYDQDILQGHYYVYKVLHPERATLGIEIEQDQDSNQPIKYHLDQLKASRNMPVGMKTQQAVQAWFNQATQKSNNPITRN